MDKDLKYCDRDGCYNLIYEGTDFCELRMSNLILFLPNPVIADALYSR